MKGLVEDVRYALRGFARNAAFALASVLTLAIGMGATTAVFALLNGVLFRPLPVERQAELVEVALEREDGSGTAYFSYPQFLQLREHAAGLAGLAAFGIAEYGVSAPGSEPQFVAAYEVSGSYFPVLGVRPARGRYFAQEVEQPGGERVVVISHDFWLRHFGGSEDVVGRPLLVNGQPLTVVAVAPPEFRGTTPLLPAGLWVPIPAVPALKPGSNIHHPGMSFWLTIVGRLARGTTLPQAQALLSDRVRALDAPELPETFTARMTQRPPARGVALSPLRSVPATTAGAAFGFMALLLVTAGAVLLIAAVNITSMMLARGTARARELSVRRSLGATRGRLIRLLLTENVLLFAFGAAAGLVVASWLTAAVPALAASVVESIGLNLDVPFDAPVIAFAFGVALLLGVLFGLAPALHATAGGLMSSLREGVTSLRGTRLRSGFVVAQVALSLALLITAGLFGRALQRALGVQPGFDPAGVVVAELDLRPYGYDVESARQLLATLLERLEARGEVDMAGLTNMQPLQGWMTAQARPEGHEEGPSGGVLHQAADGGYLRAVRVPLRAGRLFDERDRAGAQRVALVNEAFAQRFWPGEDPLGKRIFRGPPDNEMAIEVVGVVATGRYRSLTEEPQPFFYLPIAQQNATFAVVTARGAASTADLQRVLREELRALDPDLPVRTGSLARTLGVVLTPQRLAATAIGSFGVVGLLLAGVGIYGLVAFTAAQRAREVGVRIALGAQRGRVILLFLRQGITLLVIGTAIGLALALAAGRLLTALLHGVSPTDPLTYLTVPLLLAAVALLAAYLPARRASETDPMSVLRAE